LAEQAAIDEQERLLEEERAAQEEQMAQYNQTIAASVASSIEEATDYAEVDVAVIKSLWPYLRPS
jgi:hypothetical protein